MAQGVARNLEYGANEAGFVSGGTSPESNQLLDSTTVPFVQSGWREGRMKQIAIEELSDKLSELVDETRRGEDVLFTQDNVPVARLVLMPSHTAARKAGSAKHLPHFMAADFDDIPEGFEEYLP